MNSNNGFPRKKYGRYKRVPMICGMRWLQGLGRSQKRQLENQKCFGPKGKESWWWDSSLQPTLKIKREMCKTWYHNKSVENWERYKVAKKDAKIAVSKAKAKAFDGLYQSLDTREGERSIYRIAKYRERKTRDLDQVRCIRNEEGEVLVGEQDIKERWKGYSQKLFNDKHDLLEPSTNLEVGEDDRNYQYYHRIKELEVTEALKRM